ncbi:hypothetical protein [Catenulispora sp. GP43]|uniref:hypothetical protein n=1 Tax=Catenulispora sp. GP43 TaxID=3156263 RepID=UPI003513FA74
MSAVAGNAGAPADVLLRLLAPEAEDTWYALAWRDLPVAVIDAILVHPNRKIRVLFAQNAVVAPEQRARLIDDPEPRVRGALAYGPDWRPTRARPLPEDIQLRLLSDPSSSVRALAQETPLLSPRLRGPRWAPTPQPFEPDLLTSPDESDRLALAWSLAVSKDLVSALATDPSPTVRLAYASRHDLTEAERADVDVHVGPKDRVDTADWLLESEDPGTVMAGARSANLLLRRTAAYNTFLPPEGVELISRDSDYIVRLLLCENHTGIDPEVVLQTFLACEFVTKSDLLAHRDFPKHGLAARFADDPDPARRWLVSLDPVADPATLIRLLDDPDKHVRQSVVAHRNLPRDIVLACHADPATHIAALRNPGLPAALLHQALDEAGVPRIPSP